MTNMTLAIPDELNSIIKKHSQIKWSEVARQALWQQAKKVELMEALVANSTLTEEDAEEIGNLIKQKIAERHKK
ncbi:MAG: hypothetical protein ACMXYC_00150 [Candidatus Woesearchaeota archaeon]